MTVSTNELFNLVKYEEKGPNVYLPLSEISCFSRFAKTSVHLRMFIAVQSYS